MLSSMMGLLDRAEEGLHCPGRLARRSRIALAGALAVAMAATFLGFGSSTASAGVLTVTLAGSGTGTVTSSNPSGIDCSNVPGAGQTACSHDFGFNFNPATLTATPGEGSAFHSWSGGLGTCSGPTNPCTTGSLALMQSVTAIFAPEPDPPTVTTGAASDVEFPRARIVGSVNPNSGDFPISTCYFEYGLTSDYGERVACEPRAIGTGTSPVIVSASIGVLDPGKIVHYRLVAANGAGTRFGEDRTLVSASAPSDACPNSEIRAQQGALAQRLPNCGAYELVSPPFTAGQAASASAGTADGNRTVLYSQGGFADVDNLPTLGVHYLAERTEAGWQTTAIAPPAANFPYIHNSSALDYTRDGTRSLWMANLQADKGTARYTPIVRDPDGSFHLAGPTQDNSQLPVGTSEDLLTVVQRTTTHLPTTDGTSNSRSPQYRSLYLSTRGPDGQLTVRQIAYRDGATMFPDCSVDLGGTNPAGGGLTARNAISQNGDKVFFTAARDGAGGSCNATASRRVWAKVGNAEPIDLSAPQCPDTCDPTQKVASFRGASRDGSRVYFTTEQQLLPGDQDTTNQNDLYEYDFNASGQKLRLVTGSEDPEGAGVNALGLLRTSQDGAYVYFVATGRALAGQNARGVAPVPGRNNLYVYHRAADSASGTMTFVGDVGAGSGGSTQFSDHPQASSTGRFLLFETTSDLTGERTAGDTHTDVYRYDAQNDELLRVWTNDPAHNGAARTDGTTATIAPGASGSVPSGASQPVSGWEPLLQISDDGSMVGFTTREPLSPDDHNARPDAYLWQADTGEITMLTDGTSRPGKQFTGSSFKGMTPSGDSMFINSASPLVKAHTSNQEAAYVIRRNGGFPDAPLPPPPCTGEACQDAPTAPVAPLGVGSLEPSGSGNAAALRALSVFKAKRAMRRVATLRIRVPAAGRLVIRGPWVRNTGKSATQAGMVTVRLLPNRNAMRRLARRKTLTVRARVVFLAKTGGSVSKVVRLTFNQPVPRKKGGR